MTENTTQIDNMRSLLTNYYRTIIKTLQDIIPKCIMLFIVKETEDSLSSKLYNVIKTENLDDLVREYDEVHNERQNLENSNRDFRNAKELIESII